ncbi:MAG: low-specificity L-threonine aldolase [Firmicutes bacterium]|jgi:threonine aldolase|nr:low-specificity L-threonine aldolase [Bacillota bacterium]
MENLRIDLRSDTVTEPTPAMRRAMAEAEVGDDVYGEDPTVRRLEETAAQILGKEAGLFVSSGTMGNLAALLAHTQPGQEVILDANSHIFYYEAGGLARIAGLMPRPIETEKGCITAQQLRQAVRSRDIHFPPPALFCLENTHNRAGGAVLPQDEVEAVVECARELGLRTHLDGARLMNAAVFQNQPPARLAQPFDSVMLCLSKGLAAPVGSVLVGSAEFIAQARRARKILGGGMRQAGVLAAAGLIALTEMPKRLGEDHARARRLAEGLRSIAGLAVKGEVQTNMVIVEVTAEGWDAARLVQAWRSAGILTNAISPQAVRLVTHYQITDENVDRVIAVTERMMAQAG